MRRTFISMLSICIGIVVLIGAIHLGFVAPCIQAFRNHMPVYPGAELVEYNVELLHYFGYGVVTVLYYSPDDPNVVHDWYNRTMAGMRRDAMRDPDVVVWRGFVHVDVAEGGGSTIFKTPSCQRFG